MDWKASDYGEYNRMINLPLLYRMNNVRKNTISNPISITQLCESFVVRVNF